MSNSDKNIELLKKLKALAEQGVGGERENAQKLLDRLMKKYGVDTADLSDDELSDHMFKFKDRRERKILTQVMYKVATDRRSWFLKWGKGSRSMVGITCTKAEALQIQIEYEFYKALWNEEADFFLEAFIQKHKIFDMRPGHKVDEIDEESARRMRSMMNGMQNRALNPMLEEGGKQ